MGAVFEAFDLRLSRTVALKETFAQTDDLHRAFQREARLLANLRHPSLPNILDHFIEGNGQFLVMEYIAGPDLAQMLLQNGGPLPVTQVLQWSDELLDVVEHLHNHKPPIIHRDIKPANLKLSVDGRIILLDFGLAKGSAGGMTSSAASRSVAGYSPHYAPLEQSYGEKSDPRSDLYAAAATIYHLLTGHVPEEATHRASVLISENRDPLLLANQWNPVVSIQLSLILARALSLKAQERPANAAEMKELLRSSSPARDTTATTQAAHRLNQSEWRSATIYPTIPVKPEIVRDPFNVAVSETVQQESRTWKGWASTAFLVCALVAGLYIFYLSRQVSEDHPANLATASQPGKPVIPAHYRETFSSVVSLELKDSDGKSLGEANGFFIKDNGIVTDFKMIEGATEGRAVMLDGSSLQITGVSAVDRERKLVILKTDEGKAKPLTIASTPPPNNGDKMALLSISGSKDAGYTPITIKDYKKGDDELEINSSNDSAARSGAPLVNDKGEVVAMLVGSSAGGSQSHAVSSLRLRNLMKVNQPVMSLGVAGAKEVLYDFRQQDSSGMEETTISPEEKQRVLSTVFDSYLTDSNQCHNFEGSTATPEGLKEARDSGFIVPEINDRISGSFTRPGLQQTAYLIWVRECGAPHAVNWGTKRLAVFTSETLSVNVDVQDHTAILRSYDLNGDGVNELLLTGGYMQTGLLTEWGALISVKDGRLRFDRKLETVRESTCASMDTKPSVMAAVIYFTRGVGGTSPEIRVDNYQAKCTEDSEEPNPSAFRYVSTGKPPKS